MAIYRQARHPGVLYNTGAANVLFYYDFSARPCFRMMFNGCGGNVNHFESLEVCDQICSILNESDSLFSFSQASLCPCPCVSVVMAPCFNVSLSRICSSIHLPACSWAKSERQSNSIFQTGVRRVAC